MTYDSTKPANDGFLAEFPPEMREQLRAIVNDAIVNSGLLNGLKSGNANGDIPINNGVLNMNLNAEKLGGNLASAFATSGHAHSVATGSSNGFISNTDKAKLDTVATNAEVNQNTFSNILIGNTTIQADSKTDTIEFAAGKNISLTPDLTNDKLTIAIDGKVDTAATADNCIGNAATATKLQISRTINGVAFDGTENITVSANPNAHTHSKNQITDFPASLPANGGTSQTSNQLNINGTATTFNWSGQSGQPTWLWGGNSTGNMYVYNPTNFNVATAGAVRNSAGQSFTADQIWQWAIGAYDAGHSFSQNGWQKLNNGLIIQWGVGTGTTIAFPIAFPSVCFIALGITLGLRGGSSWDNELLVASWDTRALYYQRGGGTRVFIAIGA